MNVILADSMGLCFGVRRAMETAKKIRAPHRVTIHGQLVHNEIVVAELETRGFRMTARDDCAELPDTPDVLITAHGLSDHHRCRLQAAGRRLIDTTCPVVRRLHESATALAAQGYYVLVIGQSGHAEVQGIVEDLPACEIVSRVNEVRSYPSQRLGIVCQTTTPPWLAAELRLAIGLRNRHAEIRFVDTICRTTRERQAAVERLLEHVEAVVVVGGRNSNNTRALVQLCLERGVPAYHVQSAADIQRAWFDGYQTVGLTAGTSTLDSTIREVHEVLCRLEAGVSA
jgi:4-hydroxy-3-methylbut-2-enyl diphosphate reductase